MRRAALHDVQLNGAHLAADLAADGPFQITADAGQILVPEVIDHAGLYALRHLDALGDSDDHGLVLGHFAADIPHEFFQREFRLRHIDQMRGGLSELVQHRCGGGQPACVSAHDLCDRDGGNAVNGAVADDLLHGRGDIFCRGAEARRMVGDAEVVVNGLGDADDPDADLLLPEIRGKLLHGVHGVIAADVEESADLPLLQRIRDLPVDGIVLVPVRQLIAAGTEYRGGRLPEQLHVVIGEDQCFQVDEMILDQTLDAVDRAEDRVDLRFLQGFSEHADE